MKRTFGAAVGAVLFILFSSHLALRLTPKVALTIAVQASATQALNNAGQEDTAVPAVGEVFFYAVAYDNGTSSSYGTESANKPRVTASGGCQ